MNSFAEDSDKNGKIDRIRVTCETSINYDFSRFAVSVTGYDQDMSVGDEGFSSILYGPYAGGRVQYPPGRKALYGYECNSYMGHNGE